jgi:TM2 domain-containing membrane protein YozV
MADKKTHPSPALAAILSFLLPGLGQILCRQDNKGVFLLGMSLLGHWLTAGLSSLLLCPAMSLDAWLITKKINADSNVGRWEFFPGIKPLNVIPPRIILMLIVAMIAAITVIRVVKFASDYQL